MQVTGTHINYYFVCMRKLWLFANSIQMEHTSELVDMGRFIHETSYGRRSSKYEEVAIGGIKIDFYDPKEKVIHEVKKSHKLEDSHVWQLKYYIYVLEKHGIDGVSGILEYPKERKTEEVYISERDRQELESICEHIQQFIQEPVPPEVKQIPRCRKCSYFDFCHVKE